MRDETSPTPPKQDIDRHDESHREHARSRELVAFRVTVPLADTGSLIVREDSQRPKHKDTSRENPLADQRELTATEPVDSTSRGDQCGPDPSLVVAEDRRNDDCRSVLRTECVGSERDRLGEPSDSPKTATFCSDEPKSPLVAAEPSSVATVPPPVATDPPPLAVDPPPLAAESPLVAVEPPVPPTSGAEGSSHEVSDSGSRRGDNNPIIQSLTLIASMIVMLMIARFSVPRIVEEVRYSWHRGELRAEYETGGEGLKNVSMDSLSRAYEMVTSVVSPSVVHIDVKREPTATDKQMRKLLGGEFFGMSDQGSGIVVDADGYVLTNRHVIAGGESISLTLSDGRRLPARIVGTDTLTDLAVLKVEADRLLPIQWGDSDKLRVGSPVWAVGSPFGLDRTVTFGILSGKHRWVRAGEQHGASGRYQDFMQSDVAVNPGNSGGPLVDARGTLVGINTAIVGDTYQGVSFSIPSNVSKQVYESIRRTGRVQRGYLGVSLQEVPDELLVGENTRVRGALINGIASSGSPGGLAGMLRGDLIRRADGVEIHDVGHLMRIIGAAGSGTPIVLDILRGDEELQLTVNLGNRPFDLDR